MLHGEGTASISSSSRATPAGLRSNWSVIAVIEILPLGAARRQHLGQDRGDERGERDEREERAIRDRGRELGPSEPAVAGDHLAHEIDEVTEAGMAIEHVHDRTPLRHGEVARTS